jgi:hypothetical protein
MNKKSSKDSFQFDKILQKQPKNAENLQICKNEKRFYKCFCKCKNLLIKLISCFLQICNKNTVTKSSVCVRVCARVMRVVCVYM